MGSLEDTLKKIETLSQDLSAEIIIQEESHEVSYGGVDYNTGWGDVYSRDWIEYTEKVVDQPEVRLPNTQKREAAKTQLQQIYDSSGWYSARYKAGTVLCVDYETLDQQLDSWISEKQTVPDDLKKLYEMLPCSETRHKISGLLGQSETKFLADEFMRGTRLCEDELISI